MFYLLIALIFISVLFLVYGFFSYFIVKEKVIFRVGVFINPVKTKKVLKEISIDESKYIKSFSKVISLLGQGVSRVNFLTKIKEKNQKELIKAGIPLKGEEFIAIQIILSVIFILLIYKITGEITIAIIFGISGFVFPKMIVKSKKNKRIKKFSDQLGDTITLISNSLKVGHSFMQAVDTASKEMPEPISKELGKLVHEMRLGVTVETAFNNMLERIESDDLSLMITAVNIQRQTGGNLSEILDTISRTIRERIKIKGELRTLTAQGRFSGIIVAFLPFGLAAAISIIDPLYIKPLYTSKIGIILLFFACISEIIGYLIIKKIVQIDF